MKVAEYIFEFVHSKGVQHVFMLPGGGAMHLVDALGRNRDLKILSMLHEQACAIAAETYSRITNNWAVALVTSGPGGINTLTGVVGAWQESIPMLVVSGQVKRSDLTKDSGVRTLGLQEVDIVSMVKGVTKFAVTVEDPTQIRYYMEKAWHLSRTGRPGPVWIDVPMDVQAIEVSPEELPGYSPEEPDRPADSALFRRIYEMLAAAQRPVLLVGQGVHRARAAQEFLRLASLLQIPVQTTWMASDLIPYDHPLFVGNPGTLADRGSNFIIQNSDLVICVGARLDASVIGFNADEFARRAKLAVVDVDGAEVRKLRRQVDVPVVMDAKEFFQGMIGHYPGTPAHAPWSDWKAHCRDWRSRYPVMQEEYRDPARDVNTYYFGEVLSEELKENDQVVLDGSSAAVVPIFLTYRVKPGQRLFCTGGIGAMGYGLPSSIGAQVARPEVATVCVNGDGGFQLNVQELATIAGRRLPVKIFVLCNDRYGSIREMQNNHFAGRYVACDAPSGLHLPDICAVAEAYGVKSIRMNRNSDVRAVIRAAIAYDGPVLCAVRVDSEQRMMPRVSSRVEADGMMKSTPLEDLWPFLDREELERNMLPE
jgi:acetolactate synthase-1/2/3 large subunit